jgi:hypothetical protein
MLLRHHALAVESEAVMDVGGARVATSAPAPLTARARLPAVLVAAFPGPTAGVVTGGDDFQAPAVLGHPLVHTLGHPLHLHPQHFNLHHAGQVIHVT